MPIEFDGPGLPCAPIVPARRVWILPPGGLRAVTDAFRPGDIVVARAEGESFLECVRRVQRHVAAGIELRAEPLPSTPS